MPDVGAVTAVEDQDGPAPDASMDALLRQFESTLQELQDDPSLDAETRNMLHQQFTQALGELGTVAGAPAELPSRAMWMDAVQALQAGGGISDDEVNELIRQVNQALEPLQRQESQLALEFGRRLQAQGEEAALAWFRTESQRAKDAESATGQATQPLPSGPDAPLRNEMIQARAHRLRGPPR